MVEMPSEQRCSWSTWPHRSTPIILLPCRTVQSLVGLPLISAQRSADLVSQGGFHHSCARPCALWHAPGAVAAQLLHQQQHHHRSSFLATFCHRRPTVTKSTLESAAEPKLLHFACVGVDLSHFSGQSKIGEMEARNSRLCENGKS